MATIGLDKLFYAEITEDSDGGETYGTPASLAKAISADLSVELAEATLYADDGASEIVKEFKSGTLSLGIDDIGNSAASVLTGATIDSNNVVISTSEDGRKQDVCAVAPKGGTDAANRGQQGQACGNRLSGEEIQRKVPLFLAVSCEVRNSVNFACDKGRQYHVFYTDYRGYGLTQKQAGRQRKTPVESRSYRGREECSGQCNHGLVQVCV